MASQKMWKYADDCGHDTTDWAVKTANTYGTFIGVGYLDRENGDYYNRYLIAGPDGVCGIISKSKTPGTCFGCKRTYVEPEVTKVEFNFNETIAASSCQSAPGWDTLSDPKCYEVSF